MTEYAYEWRWGNQDEWVTDDTIDFVPDQDFFDGITYEDSIAMNDYEADQVWEARIRNTNTDDILFHKKVTGSQ